MTQQLDTWIARRQRAHPALQVAPTETMMRKKAISLEGVVVDIGHTPIIGALHITPAKRRSRGAMGRSSSVAYVHILVVEHERATLCGGKTVTLSEQTKTRSHW